MSVVVNPSAYVTAAADAVTIAEASSASVAKFADAEAYVEVSSLLATSASVAKFGEAEAYAD